MLRLGVKSGAPGIRTLQSRPRHVEHGRLRKVAADVVTFVGLADSEWAIIETQEQALAQSEITHFERAGYWSQQAANYAQIFSVFCR